MAIISLAVLTGIQLFAIDKPAMLEAIAIKENSHGKVGKQGELGDFQMLPINVKKYGGYDFPAALRMLNDVLADMERNHVDQDSFNVALFWNAGPKSARGKAPEISYRYALAVQVNYYRIIQARPSSSPSR